DVRDRRHPPARPAPPLPERGDASQHRRSSRRPRRPEARADGERDADDDEREHRRGAHPRAHVRAASSSSSSASRSSDATCSHVIAAPSLRTSPVAPSTKQKYGDISIPKSSHAREDCTTGTSGGASSRSFDGLSNAGSLTTTTTRASPGNGRRTSGCSPSQNVRQVRPPVERNASTVFDPTAIETATAS